MPHPQSLESIYLSYIAAINNRDWSLVASDYAQPTVTHNGTKRTNIEYAAMIEASHIPFGSRAEFVPQMLVVDSDKGTVGCRLKIEFDGGKRQLWENVFYQFTDGRIKEVFSMLEDAETGEKV
ncbi:hypothetical protein HYFRA_00007027 [Hymenoscyphus fraxineus]|uniref:SnoaL-like domain-containing protein n=1 Tax=Hymenoscyphus fraxineus TaxID=746836 RepID=A0A9N9KVE6_9HELO|nr:hypothetical protein HYFRA_00007027 [Hymenoscyphus fraxineus]